MSGLARAGLAVAALAAGLLASFFVGQWWSPVCHEGCAPALQAALWGFLLLMPLALAAVVAGATARARPWLRVVAGVAVLVVVGLALTAVAAWFQGHARLG